MLYIYLLHAKLLVVFQQKKGHLVLDTGFIRLNVHMYFSAEYQYVSVYSTCDFSASVLLLGLRTQTCIYLDFMLDLSTYSRYRGTQRVPHFLLSQRYKSLKM